MALERTGRRDEAVAAYARAVSIDDGHVRAASNLERLGGASETETPIEMPVDSVPEAVAVALPEPAESTPTEDESIEEEGESVPAEETAETVGNVEVATVDETPTR
jgi:hypothetical protein